MTYAQCSRRRMQEYVIGLALALVLCVFASLSNALADTLSGHQPAAETQPAASGPAPYPKDPAAWPGKGAIRVFDWMSQNRQAFWRERAAKRHAVVLAGDSLVGGWKTVDQDFPGVKVANRGIGGDVSRGLLFRWKEDVLDLNPKAVVVLIGTNDLSAHQSPGDTAGNIAMLLDAVSAYDPALPVILCTLPPRDNPKAPITNAALLDLNRRIEALATGRQNVAVLDLYRIFATTDGRPDERYFQNDRLHLNAVAYARFHDSLMPMLEVLHVH